MAELAEHEIADESKRGDGMNPPKTTVGFQQAALWPAGEEKRNRVPDGRPFRPRGFRGGEAEPLDEKALNKKKQEQQNRDPVIQSRMQSSGSQNASPEQHHQQAQDGHQTEEITQQRVAQIEIALQEVDSGPLLNSDQKRGDKFGDKSVKDHQMRHARKRILEMPALPKDFSQ